MTPQTVRPDQGETAAFEPSDLWRLEEDLAALRGLQTLLSDADQLTPEGWSPVWFLLKGVVQRLEDTFHVLLHEQPARRLERQPVHGNDPTPPLAVDQHLTLVSAALWACRQQHRREVHSVENPKSICCGFCVMAEHVAAGLDVLSDTHNALRGVPARE